MGSALSSFKSPVKKRSKEEAFGASEDEDDEDIRPATRRKRSNFDLSAATSWISNESGPRRPLGHVTNQNDRAPSSSSSSSSKIQAVQPSEFYGASRQARPVNGILKRKESELKSSKPSIDNIILTPKPIDFKRGLQLDITSIVHKATLQDDSADFAGDSNEPIDIQCRCSVALFFAKNDRDPKDIVQEDYTEMFRKISTCILRTTVNDEGIAMREFIGLKPFFVSANEIFVTRRKYGSGKDHQHSFEFADKYSVSIQFEPVGSQRAWPPFDMSSLTNPGMDQNPVTDLLEKGELTKNDFYLFCQTSSLLDPDRQRKPADLKLCHGKLRQKTPYALRLEFNWSLPNVLSDQPRNVRVEMDSPRSKIISGFETNEVIPASPLARKAEVVSAPNSPADGRSQRPRKAVQTYNLKALSALQQGKSPRISKSREFRQKTAQGDSEDTEGMTVAYTLGKAMAAELGVSRETTISGLTCPFCECHHSSLKDLRLHLSTNYTDFKFSLRRSSPPRMAFFVELAANGLRPSLGSKLERLRILQLSKPQTLFDLEKFLNGDESWLKAREGPENNTWPVHLRRLQDESSLSSSPHESRHSSPNTSNDTDDVLDQYPPKSLKMHRKIFYVPKTSKPLFDTITKRILQPGEEIPNSDDEKEEGWLFQKHRDIIRDLSNVTDDEKDYFFQWNPFIMTEQLTSEKYLPDAIMRFVEANKFWLAERKSRKREFTKSMEMFVMRGVISNQCFQEFIAILRAAESIGGSKKKALIEEERPASSTQLRGNLDCQCGGHTKHPDRVICHGKNCPGRFFHRECALQSGRPIQGSWYCDHCFS